MWISANSDLETHRRCHQKCQAGVPKYDMHTRPPKKKKHLKKQLLFPIIKRRNCDSQFPISLFFLGFLEQQVPKRSTPASLRLYPYWIYVMEWQKPVATRAIFFHLMRVITQWKSILLVIVTWIILPLVTVIYTWWILLALLTYSVKNIEYWSEQDMTECHN